MMNPWSIVGSTPGSGTGWRKLIGSPKSQIIFYKRATKYRSLLQTMTYKDKGSYESSPPCIYSDELRINHDDARQLRRGGLAPRAHLNMQLTIIPPPSRSAICISTSMSSLFCAGTGCIWSTFRYNCCASILRYTRMFPRATWLNI